MNKQLTGTPILLSEHGVFVREAYLAAARSLDGHGSRLLATRLARVFARAVYLGADVVSPVTEAHCPWEVALGVPPERIRPIPNGVQVKDTVTPPPGGKIVVTVGRIDPLKDVKTMLRVAGRVHRRHPDVRIPPLGPVPAGQEAYAAACYRLHDQLHLGTSFVFNGSTSDPRGAIRGGDVALLTSISEGFPIAVLEALSEGRPVVTTTVGGVREAMKGAGLTAGPRDVDGLADAVCALIEDPELARMLGMRGYRESDGASVRKPSSRAQPAASPTSPTDELKGSAVKLTAELAGLRVRAALGRAPQDRLEATVVLESWGVSSDLALEVALPAPRRRASDLLATGGTKRSNE